LEKIMSNSSKNEEAKITNNSREIAADELKQVTGGMGFPPLPFQVAALMSIAAQQGGEREGCTHDEIVHHSWAPSGSCRC
jgi:hypothetical protein